MEIQAPAPTLAPCHRSTVDQSNVMITQTRRTISNTLSVMSPPVFARRHPSIRPRDDPRSFRTGDGGR